MTVQYIYKTVIDQNHVGREGNSAVNEIYDRYRANGKITMAIEKVTDSDGVTTNTIAFIDKAAYDEWYAEIDVINTDPPTDVTYVETPIEPV